MSETETAPTAPAAPPATAILGDAPPPAAPPAAGSPPAVPEWLAGLPDDLKASPVLTRYGDVAALAKGHLEAQSLIGRKGAVPPKEGDPPEVAASWRAAIGVPEKPDGYEIAVPEGTAPETWNDGTTATLRTWAHELGLTPAQAQGLAERYAGLVNGAQAEQYEAMETELRQEWGAAYDRKVNAGVLAAKEFLSPEARAALKAAGLASNPHVIRALVRIGETMAPHDGAAGMGSGSGGPLTPAEARAEAARIRQQPGYLNRRAPDHRQLVERATELERMALVGS